MSEKLIVLPVEVTELASKVSSVKQAEVRSVLASIFAGTDEWESQVDSIVVKDVNDTMSIQLADVARKNSKAARLSAEKIIDAKRDEVQQLKVEFDLEDKLWLKAKQIMQLKFKTIEEKAEWKANYVKRYEAEQKELRTQLRHSQISIYGDINRIEFENMSDDMFNSFLAGLKSSYEAKIEAERIENDRIEAERLAQIEEQKRIAAENIRLAAEKAEADAKLAIESEKNRIIEAKLAEERKIANDKAVAEANKMKALQEELEAELKAKKDAELKAEAEQIALELKLKAEADAPINEKLILWIASLSISNAPIDNDVTRDILIKFEGFKKWALAQVSQN